MDYIPPELPPEARRQISEFAERAREGTPEQTAKTTLEGTDSSRGLLDRDPLQDPKEYGGDQHMLEAIKERSNRKYENSQRDLGIQVSHDSQKVSMQKKQRAVQLLQKEQAFNDHIKAMRKKAENDRRAARASTLGAILGIGGAAAGAYFGGAGGAMAGMGVGNGVGRAMGGDV